MSDPPPLGNAEFEYLYELYHKNLPPFVSESTLEAGSKPTSPSTPTYKQYRRAPQLPLAQADSSAVPATLQQRASYMDGTERRPITDTELATLLTYAYGEIREVDGTPRRPVASGGGRYPLELYPIVLESPDIDAGIYHYNIRDGALEALATGDYSDWLRGNWTWLTPADNAAAAIVITAIPDRSADRYGEMAYLLAVLEAGAVVQNLQLVATELSIGSRPHNGLNYRAVNEQLRLPSEEYLLTTVVFAGSPANSDI